MQRIIRPHLRIEDRRYDPIYGPHRRIVGEVEFLPSKFAIQAITEEYPRSFIADGELLDRMVMDTTERLIREVSGIVRDQLTTEFGRLLNGPRTTTYGEPR